MVINNARHFYDYKNKITHKKWKVMSFRESKSYHRKKSYTTV